MNADNRQVRLAEAKLRRAAERLLEAQENRDRALLTTGPSLSRRRAAHLTGLTPGRVQQIIDRQFRDEFPWTHRVSFKGGLTEEANEALRSVGIVLRASHGGGAVAPGGELPRPTTHHVYLIALDNEEALSRVKQALTGHGTFVAFEVNLASSRA
jgi:hypothetical protein